MITAAWRRNGTFEELRRAVSRYRRLLAAGLAAATVAAGLAALEPDQPATEPVLTAVRDLPAGTRLRASDLRAVPYPAEVVPEGAYAGAADVAGQVLAAPVRKGEPVTDLRVLGPSLLRSYAEPGGGEVVAAPVRVADTGVLAYVRVGSRVDVLAAGASGSVVPPPLPGLGAFGAGSDGARPRRTTSKAPGAAPGSATTPVGERVNGGERIDGGVPLRGGESPPAGEPVHSGFDDAGVEAVTLVQAAPVIAVPGAEPERAGLGGDAGIGGNLTGGGAGGDGLVLLAVPPEAARDLARAAVTSRLSLVLRG